MRTSILCVVLLCITFNARSQEVFGVKGTIVDSTKTRIESGSIIALSPADSSVIKGSVFWDGSAELLGISSPEILLKISASGYTPYYQLIRFSEPLFDLGEIQLSVAVQDIEGVEVVYRRPMFERQVGKLIVNVDETILSEKGTVLDLLKSAPNVIVKSGGDVQVVGKGSAILYLDGQRINSVEFLASLSSTDIDRIEVIENPSAKYDAEGNAVIEIITKQGAMNGFQGSLGLRGMKRTYEQAAYWGSLTWRKDWFTLFVSAGQYTGKLREEEQYYRTVHGTNPIDMENDVLRDIDHKFDTWLWLDMDFRLDSVSTLSTSYSGSGLTSLLNADNVNRIYESDVYVGSLSSVTKGEEQRLSNSISLGYNRELDTLGSNLNITGQYRLFNSTNFNEIYQVTDFGIPIENWFESRNFNDISIYAARADWNEVFSDKLKLDMGVKNSYVTNTSGVNFKYLDNDVWRTDTSLYNGFGYEENILAAYAEIKGKIKNFSYSAGLRYEWTVNSGRSKIVGGAAFDRNYHNIFPNVQLNYDITEDLVIGASYTNRIQRPSYQDLDPFIIYIDSLSSFRGNPQLLPSYSHNVELSLVYMEYASITLGYTNTRNPMFLTVEQNPGTNTFSAITRNIESSEMYTIGLVLPYELDWWTTFNAFGYNFNNYIYRDNATLAVSNEPTFYVSLYNEFRIPKWFNIELTYDYVTPGSQGFFVVQPYHNLGGSISRKFFKDQLSLRFSVFDVLKTEYERGASNLEGFDVSYTSWMDSRSFMLTAIWNFGKLKDDSLKGKLIDGDEKGRIKE